jgi:hypothetical protein
MAAADLEQRIDEYTPDIAKTARGALAKMRKRLPGTIQLVYDNYNALAIGFSATEKTSDIICSITLYPRWVSLFFPRGSELDDPGHLLQGSGAKVRHIVLEAADTLDVPEVDALIADALARAPTPPDEHRKARVVVKMVAAKRRPRRPATR